MTFRLALFFLFCTMLALAPHNCTAQPAKKASPPSVGTGQAKGGDGQFGVVYTFDNNGAKVNIKLVGVEFIASRFSIQPGMIIVPKIGEKVCVLHFTVKNPNTTDMYCSGDLIPYSVVTKDGILHNRETDLRDSNEKHALSVTIKPGQPIPGELLSGVILRAEDTVDKVIINLGRFGTSDKVTRFPVGKAPNIIKPIPAPSADPADATGMGALKQLPATIGTTYPLGLYDVVINSITFVPGAIGAANPGDGKRYLVVNATVTNRAWDKTYTNRPLAGTLVTSDDEKTKDFEWLKGKRDENAEGQSLDPDDTMTFRMAFVVPNDVTGKKLSLAEVVDNMGGESRQLVFDLSSIK